MDEKNRSENLLKGVADFIEEGHHQGEEEERLDDEIKAAGIDPKAYLSRFSKMVESAVVQHRQAVRADRLGAASKIEALLKRVKKKLGKMTPEDEKAWTAKLEPRLAGAYFRNFKSASAADKVGMIEDLELLEKLDEFMKEYDE